MDSDIDVFNKQLSLAERCKNFADELRAELLSAFELESNSSAFVVGFHVRHVLDPNAPTIALSYYRDADASGTTDIENSIEDNPRKVLKKNNSYDLQTLNHVIDTLYYDNNAAAKVSKRETIEPNDEPNTTGQLPRRTAEVTRLLVWIDFLEDPPGSEGDRDNPGCHQFDIKLNSRSRCRHGKQKINDNEWRCGHFAVLKNAFGDDHLSQVSMFASTGNIDRQAEEEEPEKKGDNASEDKNLFTDYVCGAEKFCKQFRIPDSLSGYRVITAAIYQLGRYACAGNVGAQEERYGRNTITALLRSDSAFGVVFGATVIFRATHCESKFESEDAWRPKIQQIVVEFLDQKWAEFVDSRFHFPKSTLFSRGEAAATWADIEAAVWGKDWALGVSAEHQIAKRLRNRVLGDEPLSADTDPERHCRSSSIGSLEKQWRAWSQLTTCPVHAFLQVLRSYAGERLEGQFLTFGFVLGNPQLLTHTPRERPFPITKSPKHTRPVDFFTRGQLIKQVHLVAAPEERAVVIPYTRCDSGGPEGKIAAYMLEFDEAMEEFRAKEWAALWRDVFVPYLYYTERFPWAVAGFIGPGAEVRVFVDCTIAAYHDEKGWWDVRVDDIICNIWGEVCAELGLEDRDSSDDSSNKPLPEQATQAQEHQRHIGDERRKIFRTVAALMSIALQMSRFANPEAKGGMIVWLAGTEEQPWDCESPFADLQPHEWFHWAQERLKDLKQQNGQESNKVTELNELNEQLEAVLKRFSLPPASTPDSASKLRSMSGWDAAKMEVRAKREDYEAQSDPANGGFDSATKELIRALKSFALTENLNTSEPLRSGNSRKPRRPWLRGKSLTDPDGKLNFANAKLVLQAAKQDGGIIIKQAAKVKCGDNLDSNVDEAAPNVVVAFGQRLMPQRADSDEVESLGGTRRASARALMRAGHPRVTDGSFVIAVSSDGPLSIWVKRSASRDPAEFTLGDYREW